MSLYVDIEKVLGSFTLRVRFTSENGVLSLMGKSGCGKSMTLKCIAGVEKPDKGKIILDGVTLFDSENKINLPPQKRRVGLLFQNYALFPNMTAIENIRAGANRIKDKNEKNSKIKALMDSFGVTELANHYPSQLSGGQQQRIALARILISEPECLLLDEPFSALDTHLRFITERETAKVIENFGKTVILVSHNIDEVYRLTDKIAIMYEGIIEALGDKTDIISNPSTVNSALLTGWSNISPAKVVDESHIFTQHWGLTIKVTSQNNFLTSTSENNCVKYAALRPERIRPASNEISNTFKMKVEASAVNPYDTTLLLKLSDKNQPLPCKVSTEWWQTNKSENITVFIPEDCVALLTD